MKLSINLLCAAGKLDASHYPLLELAKECGYDGVEIPVLEGTERDYSELGKELDRLHMSRTATGIMPPDHDANPLSSDPDVRKRGVEHLDWLLSCSQALGAECIGGPFHAPLGHFTGAGPTKDEVSRGAEAHRRMAELAEKAEIELALEPLNRFETYFLNTAEQARAYSERVGHPSFGIMYDTFHSNIEEHSQPDAVRTLGKHLKVLHASENDRGIPGRGHIDFASIFRAARSIGFDNWVVVEAFGSAVPELAAATRVWRPLFPDHKTLFQEAHAFIRKAWNDEK